MLFVRSVETTLTPFSRLFWRAFREGIAAITQEFDARVVACSDGVDVVVVSGELDAATAPQLHQALLGRFSPCSTLTLDMEAVTFMGVAGLTALEEIGLLVQAADQQLVLRRPSRPVRYLLDFRRRFASSEPWMVESEGVTV